MEANEVQELKEQAENAEKESALRPVALTMTVLAVLVAVTTVLGHRTHTEAVLDQNKATDQWNLYQAHKIRSYDTTLAQNQLKVIVIGDKEEAAQQAKDYAGRQAKWADETKDDQEKAGALQEKVEQAEVRANRFDLGEALLEIGLVITSVTLLTRSRLYWYFGIVFSLGGIASVVSAFFLQ